MLELPRKNRVYLPHKKFKKKLSTILGFRPRNLFLYQLALVHKSIAQKYFNDVSLNNERLEFLGDAMLDSIIAEHLYHKFPNEDEGFLTQLRSKIVNRETLKRISLKLGIGNLVLSRMNSDKHKSVYGDALEALIGAVYLDRGYKKTRKFVLKKIVDLHLNLKTLSETEIDFKSRIIEWGQKNKKEITFDHQEKIDRKTNAPVFLSYLLIFNEIVGMGLGTSKKEAEQNAAKQALEKLEAELN